MLVEWDGQEVFVIYSFPDDGEYPDGNGTPSDPVDFEMEFVDDRETASLVVNNVAPRLMEHPSFSWGVGEFGSSLATVSVRFSDVGVFDSHEATVTWADGVTTTAIDSCDEMDLEANCNVDKTITIVREISDVRGLNLLPFTVEVKDDDNGEDDGGGTGSKRVKLDVLRNVDDDNGNDRVDLRDRGFADDDLKSLDLSELKTEEMDPTFGDFLLSYDPATILLWDSQQKDNLILPFIGENVDGEGEIDGIPYTGQDSVWVEGRSLGRTAVTLSWQRDAEDTTDEWLANDTVIGGVADVTVWGVDLDIDSDNDDGFNYPENDDWEEHLEDHSHGLGKMIFDNASHYVPVRLRLPPGLDPNDPTIRVRIEYPEQSARGNLYLFNGPKASGPFSELLRPGSYQLQKLKYDVASGGLTLWAEADNVSVFDTLQDAWDSKPDAKIEASVEGVDLPELEDEVKFMLVLPDSFYPTLGGLSEKATFDRRTVRNGLASKIVYDGVQDGPQFALNLQHEVEVRHLLKESQDESGLSDAEIDFILGAIFRWPVSHDPPPPISGALDIGLYMDYGAPNPGEYVLAIGGTETNDWQDILTDVYQFAERGDPQYTVSLKLGLLMGEVPDFTGQLMVTGHSLGGGLASAAAIGGNFQADTFNAAGLQRHTFFEYRDAGNPDAPDKPIDKDALARYDAGPELLVDAYRVWFSGFRFDPIAELIDWLPGPEIPGVDLSENTVTDAPDMLSFLQHYSPLVPESDGIAIEGLYNLTLAELVFVKSVGNVLRSIDPETPYWWAAALFAIRNIAGTDGAISALYKMGKSHSMAESVMFGLLHDDETGWNVYDTNNPNVGPR